MTSRALKSQK